MSPPRSSATASLRGKANFAPFASAKAALRNLAQSLAREYGPLDSRAGRAAVEREFLMPLRDRLTRSFGKRALAALLRE
jgi:hypothetical protein